MKKEKFNADEYEKERIIGFYYHNSQTPTTTILFFFIKPAQFSKPDN